MKNRLPPRWAIISDGVKPVYLKDHGHIVINQNPDNDFAEAIPEAHDQAEPHGSFSV